LYGKVGRILFIDLSSKKIKNEYITDFKDFIGGRSINQWLLFDLLKKL